MSPGITITDVWVGTAPRDFPRLFTGLRPLTIPEVAARLGCSVRLAHKLFDAGDLAGHRVGRRKVVYADSVDSYIREHRNAPKEKVPPAKRGPAGRRVPRGKPTLPVRPFRHLR
jgi:excisionase family DNA binding protein